MSYFKKEQFQVFRIPGLAERMEALQNKIQPLFRELGEHFSAELSSYGVGEFYPHVAKHARRTVNPPTDSWVAFAPSKRGYKALPHFQIGLWDDRLFITLVVIYENQNKKGIAEALLSHQEQLFNLPQHYVLSGNHMKKAEDSLETLGKEGVVKLIDRLHTVKSAEWVIGQQLSIEEVIQYNKKEFYELVQNTFQQLFDCYLLMINAPQVEKTF